jgi:sugar lactone lactonase YvrE
MLFGLGAGVVGSATGIATAAPGRGRGLSVAASFVDFGVTGVAVGDDGRMFVNQPRFPWLVSDQGNRPRDVANVDISVAEVRGGNSLVPYPDEEWNRDGWDQENDEWNESEYPAAETFVNVQSVYVDPDNPETLWILDTGNPELSGDGTGIVPDGPKLVEVDLRTDTVVKRVFYDRAGVDGNDLTPRGVDEPGAGDDANERTAYLNDVRVSADQNWAFTTDSELGALVVTDLGASGPDHTRARRLFDDPDPYFQTHDGGVAIPVGPHEGQDAPLPIADVHSDGIAIDPRDDCVYFHSLSGFELYRSPLSELTDFGLAESEIAIENPARTDATDGMIADGKGVYHSDLENDAVTRWNYGESGTETIVQDSKRLHWPDSFAFGPDGDLYVTTSKIHLEATGNRRRPFRVLRVKAGNL